MLTDYVELYPRDWVPDLTRTGGDRPHIVIMIPRQTWIDAGRPESIEDWQKCIIAAATYAALNDAALKQFIDDAVAKERERILTILEDAASPVRRTPVARHNLLRVIACIRAGEPVRKGEL